MKMLITLIKRTNILRLKSQQGKVKISGPFGQNVRLKSYTNFITILVIFRIFYSQFSGPKPKAKPSPKNKGKKVEDDDQPLPKKKTNNPALIKKSQPLPTPASKGIHSLFSIEFPPKMTSFAALSALGMKCLPRACKSHSLPLGDHAILYFN